MSYSLVETQQPRLVSQTIVLGVALLVQAISIPALWGQVSSSGDVLGRYSTGYALALGLHVLISLVWFALLIVRHRLPGWIERIPPRLRDLLIIIPGLVLFGFWLTSFEAVIKSYLALNWLLLVALMLISAPDAPVQKRWPRLLLGVTALFLIPMCMTVLAERSFEPDEAMWADYATTPFVGEGIYARAWLQEPTPIKPGLGWFIAGVGWLLENVAFQIEVIRVVNFAGYLLAFVGIYLVSARLYGRAAGAVSAAFAILSQSFIGFPHYRTIFHMPAVASFVLLAAVTGRTTQQKRISMLAHFCAGFLAALAFEIHASSIVYTVGFGVVYGGEWLLTSYRQWRLADIRPLLAFVLGGVLGAAVYFVLNILPVGGLDAYLSALVGQWGGRSSYWLVPSRLLEWPSWLELVLIVLTLTYLIWRRGAADKFLLSIILCTFAAAVLFDTQGYLHTLSAFLLIPVGALLVDALRGANTATDQTRRGVILAACALLMLAGQMLSTFRTSAEFTQWLRTGEPPPFLYAELTPLLEPYIMPDDVVVSTHQLMWTFPHARLVTHGAGGNQAAIKPEVYTDERAVWDDVRPTVIVNVQHEMDMDAGLLSYMADHDFQTCYEADVLGRLVQVFRADCPPL